MRLPLGIMSVFTVALGLACTESATESTFAYPEADDTVYVRDNFFAPSNITVPVNSTVLYRWAGSNEHNVHFTSAGAPSGCGLRDIGFCLISFSTGGAFDFQCDPHVNGGMFGGVTVTP